MAKIKSDKVYHPRSRKAAQLGREVTRDLKKHQRRERKSKQDRFFHRRLVWFQDHLRQMQPERLRLVEQHINTPQSLHKVRYSEAEIHAMIRLYLEHREDTLEPHLAKSSKSIRTTLLEGLETKEYSDAGLLVPDFTKAAHVNTFMLWVSEEIIGEREAAARFQLRRYKRPAETLTELWDEIQKSAEQQGTLTTANTGDTEDTVGADSVAMSE